MSVDSGPNNNDASLDPVVVEAQERWDTCNSWFSDARRNWLEDYKMANADPYNLDAWPNSIRRARDYDDKPVLTINKIRQHNLEIINKAKKNKGSVKIRPTGNGATFESAQIWEALMRQIQYQSRAPDHYDRALSFMVQAGAGYLRVYTEWEKGTMHQQAKITSINDPLTVFFDRDAKGLVKEDMNYAMIFEDQDKEEFVKYHKNWAKYATDQALVEGGDWVSSDRVRKCEYFRRVEEKQKLFSVVKEGEQPRIFSEKTLGDVAGKRIIDDLVEQSKDPSSGVQMREEESMKVEWYYIIGNHIVDESVWPGDTIPLVPLIAEEVILDGVYDWKSHTRAMIDPQRMYNFWAALDLHTPLPTPSGWTTMRDVQVGDWLLDEQGKPVQVIGTSPVYANHKCFRVEFDDGTSIIADATHLWEVEERGKRRAATYDWSKHVITTAELTPKKHFIYTVKPLELPAVDLPIDPYILGLWLGDGTSANGAITAGLSDIDEVWENITSCGYKAGCPRVYQENSGHITIHGLSEQLRKEGLLGNKHIPAKYLRASKDQRLALLQGMMDTDGHYGSSNNICGFTNADSRIADGFAELLRSLGLKSSYVMRKAAERKFPSGKTYACQPFYQFSFTADPDLQIFRLQRKRILQEQRRNTHDRRTKRYRIVSVTEVPSVPVKCVSVDSEAHLYLAGPGMVPTHNSTAVEYGANQTKTPWIAAVQAIENYEVYWNNANRVSNAVLPYNAFMDDGTTAIPPPQRIAPPVPAPVALSGMQIADQEMLMVSGQGPNVMEGQGNERTGSAIDRRMDQAETATFHYVNAQNQAIARIGRILMEIGPKIYDVQRVQRCLANDGTSFEVMIDPRQQKAHDARVNYETQKVEQVLWNPSVGTFDVQVDVGPDYGTRRQEAVNSLSLLLTQAPQLVSIIGDILLRNSDFDQADEAAARLRRMVPPAALGEGPSVQEQQMQAQLQEMQKLLQSLMEESAMDKIKLKGKDALRQVDSFKALTDRLKMLFDSVNKTKQTQIMAHQTPGGEGARSAVNAGVTTAELEMLITQALKETFNVSLDPVVDATQPVLQEAALGGNQQQAFSFMSAPGAPKPVVHVGADGRIYARDYSGSNSYRPI